MHIPTSERCSVLFGWCVLLPNNQSLLYTMMLEVSRCYIPSGKCMCMAEQQLDFDGFFFSFPLFFISLPQNICQPFQKIYVPSFCICINLIFIFFIAICFSCAILRCFFNFISHHFISFYFLFNLVLILLIAIF
jgi:hypothetical protein